MWHKKSNRRISGGKIHEKRKRRKHELGRETLPCRIGDEERRKTLKVRGVNNQKQRLQKASEANMTDHSSGETTTVKIEKVIENPANPHFARRDIVTKGATIQTSEGKARVTSRPGQTGQVNAVKIEE